MDFIENIKNVVKNFIKDEYPDLLSIHYPVYAKVMRKYQVKDAYYVDVRILTKNKDIDENYPEIPKLKGNYEKGTLVRVLFYYNDINKPYIDGSVE